MTAQPRMRLYTVQGFNGINAPPMPAIMARWLGTVYSTTTGLRGTGRSVYPNGLAYFPNDDVANAFNTDSILFDWQFNSAIGGTEDIVRRRISSSYFVGLRRTAAGYVQYYNEVHGTTFTSTRKFTSGVPRKVEWITYRRAARSSVEQGHFQVWVEGELWLEAQNVFLPELGWGGVYWHSAGATDAQLADFAMYVGSGGWTDGDVRSDVVGNPRVLPLYVNAAGAHSDGTPTGAFNVWTAVDEQPLSDTGTYSTLLGANPTDKDSYSLEDLPGTVSRVLGLSGMYFVKTSSGVHFSPPLFLRINPATDEYAEQDSVVENPSAYTPGSTFDGYAQGLWSKSPATGVELTPAEVNGAELGWRATAFATNTSVSHVYAEVLCYVSPPAATPAPVAQKSLIIHKVHRLAKLWKLEPRWGMPMYFTDHDSPLVFRGRTYVPAGGWSSTDERAELGLKESNVDFSGAITSAAITVDDLRAGRYKGARITEYLVDYMHPFAGALRTRPRTIEPDEIDSEVWRATASGMLDRLRDRAGDAYYPRCRFHLFDDDYPISTTQPTWERGCKLDSLGYLQSGFVGTVTSRRVFQITDVGTVTANYYAGGLILFRNGANADVCGQIKSHGAGSNVTYELHLPMPFDVLQLETVAIWPGCNFLIGTVNAGDCEDKFNNVKNFGGFMLIPGTDEATRGSKS